MLHFRQDPQDLPSLTLLFFDGYNAEDPLFVADAARRLAAASKQGARAIVLHASDMAVERVREAAETPATDEDGLSEAVERGVSMSNQSITRRMIDEGLSAVSIQGNHRGLFQVGEDGSLRTGGTEWLDRAVSMGGMPVISLLAEAGNGRVVEAEPVLAIDRIVDSLSKMWEVTVVYFTTNRKSGLFEPDGSRLDTVARDRLQGFKEVPEVAASAEVGTASAVFITNTAGIRSDGAISGTRVT